MKSVKVDAATSFVIKGQVESLSDTDDNGPKEGSVVEFRLNVCMAENKIVVWYEIP